MGNLGGKTSWETEGKEGKDILFAEGWGRVRLKGS
jgi:hypothetical protein